MRCHSEGCNSEESPMKRVFIWDISLAFEMTSMSFWRPQGRKNLLNRNIYRVKYFTVVLHDKGIPFEIPRRPTSLARNDRDVILNGMSMKERSEMKNLTLKKERLRFLTCVRNNKMGCRPCPEWQKSLQRKSNRHGIFHTHRLTLLIARSPARKALYNP